MHDPFPLCFTGLGNIDPCRLCSTPAHSCGNGFFSMNFRIDLRPQETHLHAFPGENYYSKAQSKTPRLRSESLGPGTINDEEEHREACNSRLGFSRVSGFRILGLGLRILLGFGV